MKRFQLKLRPCNHGWRAEIPGTGPAVYAESIGGVRGKMRRALQRARSLSRTEEVEFDEELELPAEVTGAITAHSDASARERAANAARREEESRAIRTLRAARLSVRDIAAFLGLRRSAVHAAIAATEADP